MEHPETRPGEALRVLRAMERKKAADSLRLQGVRQEPGLKGLEKFRQLVEAEVKRGRQKVAAWEGPEERRR